MLRQGLTIRFQAPGRSMLPTIHDGDTLVVEAVDSSCVRRGDVVVVAEPSRVCAHRVVRVPKRGDDFFVLRGDSLAACDAPVPPERILGRVAWVERGGRRVPVNGMVVRLKMVLWRLVLGSRRIVGALGIRDRLRWRFRSTISVACFARVTPARELSSPLVRAKGS